MLTSVNQFAKMDYLSPLSKLQEAHQDMVHDGSAGVMNTLSIRPGSLYKTPTGDEKCNAESLRLRRSHFA